MELHMVERFKSNNPARSHLGLSGICHPDGPFPITSQRITIKLNATCTVS